MVKVCVLVPRGVCPSLIPVRNFLAAAWLLAILASDSVIICGVLGMVQGAPESVYYNGMSQERRSHQAHRFPAATRARSGYFKADTRGSQSNAPKGNSSPRYQTRGCLLPPGTSLDYAASPKYWHIHTRFCSLDVSCLDQTRGFRDIEMGAGLTCYPLLLDVNSQLQHSRGSVVGLK